MSLYKRENSSFWWIRLPAAPGELKPLRVSSGTTDRKQAQRLHDRLKAERWEQDKLGKKIEHTWDEAAERWLEETAHKRTTGQDKQNLEWLYPYLGGKALSAISRDLLDKVLRIRAQTVKPATANRYMSLVRSILRRARDDWEWLDRIPKVRMMRVRNERLRALTRGEWLALRAELPDHLRDLAEFTLATGLRQGNVTGLRWARVDMGKRHLWVDGSEHKNGRHHAVPLNDAAMTVLQRRQGKDRLWVFTYNGKPIEQVSTKAWYAALRRAGIEDFRWHDLRHTWATWHRQAGTPTYELQRLGGWLTPAMVERYAHLAPEGLQAAASRLDNLFAGTN